MSRVSRFVMACLLGWLPAMGHADGGIGSEIFGHYEVHYSIIPTAFLQPEIAGAYQVTRADDRALLTIAVTDRDHPLAGGQPVTLKGSRTDLIHREEIAFKTIQEQDVTYYISEFRFAARDRWIFDIVITPAGETRAFQLHFGKTFEPAP